MDTQFHSASDFGLCSGEHSEELTVINREGNPLVMLKSILLETEEESNAAAIRPPHGDLRFLEIMSSINFGVSHASSEYLGSFCTFDADKLDWENPAELDCSPISSYMEIDELSSFPAEEMLQLYTCHFERYRDTAKRFSVLILERRTGSGSVGKRPLSMAIIDDTGIRAAIGSRQCDSIQFLIQLHAALKAQLQGMRLPIADELTVVILE